MSKNTLLSELINYISANDSGNVVIVAPTSGLALDVNGTGRFTSSLTASTFTSNVTSGIFLNNSSGGTNATQVRINNTGGDLRMGIESSTGTTIQLNTLAYAAVLGNQANNPLQFTTNGTARMTILADGSVGIGTITPTVRLEARNDSTTAYNASTGTTNRILNIRNATSGTGYNAFMNFITEPNGEWYLGAVSKANYSDFVFMSRDASYGERIRITSGGNVGIGTASPGDFIDAGLGLAIINTSGRSALALGSTQGTANEVLGRLSFTNTNSTNIGSKRLAYISGVRGTTDNSAYLEFGTADDALGTQRMIISQAGNVSINTTNAYTSRLSVQAAAANRPAIKAGFGASAGNGYWILGDNYTLDESLISIGVDFSGGGLVLGSALAPSTTTQGAFISTQAQFGGYGSAIRLSTSGEIYFYNGTQNSVISTGSAKSASIAMTILQTGNVGIGTTNPLVRLHVGNGTQSAINGAGNKIHIATTGTRSALLTLANSAGGTTVEGQFESSAETGDLRVIIGSTSNHPVIFRANNTEYMRITSGGNVGIGTSSPTGTYGKLSVAGGISILDDNNAKLEIGRYSSGAPNSYIKLGANSNSLRITNNTDVADVFIINNNSSLIQNGINVRLTKTGGTSITFTLSLGSIGAWTPGYATIRVSGTRGGLQEHYAAMYFLKLVYFQSSNVTAVNNVSGDTGSASIAVTTAFTSGNTIMTITISDVGASTDYMIADIDASFQTGIGSIT